MQKKLSKAASIAVFTLPALIFYTVFVFSGVIRTVYGSLFRWDGISDGAYVGFKNFVKIFSQDQFYIALRNGLISVAILLTIQIGLALLFALILSEKEIRFKKMFRVTFFLPMVMSVSAVCILITAILMPEGGLLNNLMTRMGFTFQQSWLVKENSSIFAVSFANAWQFFGLFLTIFYTGIKNIPERYYEAAILDGATKFQVYKNITIPLLRDIISFSVLLSVLAGLNQFAQNLIITGGGPGYSSYSLTLLLYTRGFGGNDFGYGSALAVIIIAQALVATLLIRKLISRQSITY
jgi:raffinose/stachyose/melibiose transport system permease protein